jgi:hypothetical protein
LSRFVRNAPWEYPAGVPDKSFDARLRRLWVTDWVSAVPTFAACTACGERFTVPVAAHSRAMAQANLQYQFDQHKCKRNDAS